MADDGAVKPATSIEKVCRVLDAFRSKRVMGITEIAAAAGLLPSDVHRIVRSLLSFGYVAQEDATRKYRLGLELLKLGHLVHQRIELREVSRPFMRQLSELAQATANLAIFDPHDLEIIFIDQIDSPGEVQIRFRVGSRATPHATALGKVLLASLDRWTAARVLKKNGLQRRTKRTITEISKLEEELDRVRAQGFAIDREEAVEGACCIGAPVRNHKGETVAALSCSTMAAHLSTAGEARLISLVRAAAGRISTGLGYERGRGEAKIAPRKRRAAVSPA